MTPSTPSPKPWADTPLALIPTPLFITKKHDMFTSGASHMCMVHNSIFRGYNSIYHQALHVGDEDKRDFIAYCLTWHKFVTAHAENEEDSLFPRMEGLLNDKTLFEEAHREHDAFMPGIAKFGEYLVNLKTVSEFSGTELLEVMASFQEPFEAHFRAEVSTIAGLANHPRTPEEGSVKEKATAAAFDRREGISLIVSGVIDVLPFFLFNFDCEYEDGLWKNWPPIPGPVRWTLITAAKVLYGGMWKFASCDAAGRKRQLYALPVLEGEL